MPYSSNITLKLSLVCVTTSALSWAWLLVGNVLVIFEFLFHQPTWYLWKMYDTNDCDILIKDVTVQSVISWKKVIVVCFMLCYAIFYPIYHVTTPIQEEINVAIANTDKMVAHFYVAAYTCRSNGGTLWCLEYAKFESFVWCSGPGCRKVG